MEAGYALRRKSAIRARRARFAIDLRSRFSNALRDAGVRVGEPCSFADLATTPSWALHPRPKVSRRTAVHPGPRRLARKPNAEAGRANRKGTSSTAEEISRPMAAFPGATPEQQRVAWGRDAGFVGPCFNPAPYPKNAYASGSPPIALPQYRNGQQRRSLVS